jgi:hypothetical protein
VKKNSSPSVVLPQALSTNSPQLLVPPSETNLLEILHKIFSHSVPSFLVPLMLLKELPLMLLNKKSKEELVKKTSGHSDPSLQVLSKNSPQLLLKLLPMKSKEI